MISLACCHCSRSLLSLKGEEKKERHLCTLVCLFLFSSFCYFLFFNLFVMWISSSALSLKIFLHPQGSLFHTQTSALAHRTPNLSLSELCSIMTSVTKSLPPERRRTGSALSRVLHLCSPGLFSLAAALLSPLCSPRGSKAITPICTG